MSLPSYNRSLHRIAIATAVATFPLNRQRQSGFMHPFLATSSRSGLDLTLPYYWNIAPNYDATFYPRYMSKRGFQLGALLFAGKNFAEGVKIMDRALKHFAIGNAGTDCAHAVQPSAMILALLRSEVAESKPK